MDGKKWSNTMATKISRYHPFRLFLWGYVKDRVYRTPVCDVETLQSRIIDVLATVNKEMLENTWREIEYRLDILRATNGHMLKSINSMKN